MSRCLLVYYSQHGTTARVAERIAAGLPAQYQVDLCNIKDDPPPPLEGYDLLGIGSPVYFCTPPGNVRAYLNRLPPLRGIPAFVFVLHGSDPGDTSTRIRRALLRKGANDLGFFRCFGAEVNYLFVNRGHLFSPDHPTPHELDQAEDFGREMAERAAGKPFDKPVDDPPARPAFRLLPYIATPWTARHLMSRLLRLDSKRCNGCGLCTRLCPEKNITARTGGRLVWGRDCIFCLTCKLRCPQEAVTSPLDWRLMEAMMDIFASQVLKDPSIDHARVALRRGRIERL